MADGPIFPPLPAAPGPATGTGTPSLPVKPPIIVGQPNIPPVGVGFDPVKEFNNIAAGFPQEMPQDVYDFYRGQFFKNRVIPSIKQDESINAGWNVFKEKTNRPNLLNAPTHALLHAAIAAHATIDSLLAPIRGLTPNNSMWKAAAEDMQKMQTLAAREGMNTTLDTMGGSFAGMAVDLPLLSAVAGPGAAAVVRLGGMAGRAAEVANSALRGGMAFGAYDATSSDNNRLVAGLQGFVLGAVTEMALGRMLGGSHVEAPKLTEELEKTVASGGKLPGPLDEAVAKKAVQATDTARAEGRAKSWVQSTGQRGARVTVTDVGGNTVPLEIKSGREYDTVRQVQQLVQQGGSVEKFEVHPEDLPLMTRYLQVEEGVVNAKRAKTVVRTEEGQAPAIAEFMQQGGAEVAHVEPGHIVLDTQAEVAPESTAPKVEVIPAAKAEIMPIPEDAKVATQRMQQEVQGAYNSQKPVRTEDVVFKRMEEEGLPDSAIDEMMLGKLTRVSEPDLTRWIQAIKTRTEAMEEGKRVAEQRPTAKVRDIPDQAYLAESTPEGEKNPITPRKTLLQTLRDATGKTFKQTPSGMRVTISPESMTELGNPGAKVYGATTEGPEGPVRIFTGPNRKIQYHEGLHANMMMAGQFQRFSDIIPEGQRSVVMDLMKGLGGPKGSPHYTAQAPYILANEAFVHAATAVRMNDVRLLNLIAGWDTSIARVKDFVYQTADAVLNDSEWVRPSKAVFNLRRQMGDLIRRTGDDVMEAAEKGSAPIGGTTWYDPKRGWVLREPAGNEVQFADINHMWDHVMNLHEPLAAPNYSYMADLAGVRGGMTPPGQAPMGRTPPNPDGSISGGQFGWNALSSLWRPMLPWAASLDEKLNSIARVSGKNFPVFNLMSAVDKAGAEADHWTEKVYASVAPLMEKFKDKKMYDVFEYLTHPEGERTPALQAQLKMSPEQSLAAEKYATWLKEFHGDTGIDVQHYLTDQHVRLRGMGWDPNQVWGPDLGPGNYQSFWNKAIREGDWNPEDQHVGRLTSFLIRSGREKMFTSEPLDALNKMINGKTPAGDFILPNSVRYPLQNYHNYMKNVPDQGQQMINSTLQNLIGGLNQRFALVNKHLPDNAQISLITATPKDVINKMMLLSYAMGLGARPAIMARDAAAVFMTGMPIMGPGRFVRAMGSGLTRQGFRFADESGALLSTHNIGEMYGEIFNDVPLQGKNWSGRLMKWSNQLLGPSRWGNNAGRSIIFNGEYYDALDAIKGVREGTKSVDSLMKDTMLHWHDGPLQKQLLGMVADQSQPAESVAKEFGRKAVDLSQWPYRRGTQPMALRYGAGRILGQYGVWPANYVDLAARVGRKWFSDPATAARTTATWAAINHTFMTVGNANGADLSRWFWLSPTGYAGSPHMEFIQNLMQSAENTDQGRAARKAVLNYPMNFVPARIEMEAVLGAIETNPDWPPTHDNFLKVLGFKPLEDVTRGADWEDWVRYQLGQPKGKEVK